MRPRKQKDRYDRKLQRKHSDNGRTDRARHRERQHKNVRALNLKPCLPNFLHLKLDHSSPDGFASFGSGTTSTTALSSVPVSSFIAPEPKPYICTAGVNIFPVIDRASAGGPAFA